MTKALRPDKTAIRKTLSPEKPAALMILGMHRSGTSALTRTVSLLGADLPKNLMGATRGNERGHWESDDLVPIHERLLTAIGSRWDDWTALDPSLLNNAALAGFRNEILACLAKDFVGSSLFTVKDPRISRFVPFWQDILQSFGARPCYIIALRNPVEVAYSLHRRDGFLLEKSYLIWLRHTLDAERYTRGQTRSFVNYEDLLADWKGVVGQVAHSFMLDWPRPADDAGPDISAFLAAEARHHHVTPDELYSRPEISRWVKDAYRALQLLLHEKDVAAQYAVLDRITAELSDADLAFGTVTNHYLKAWADRGNELDHALRENEQLRDLLEQERQKGRNADAAFEVAKQRHAADLQERAREIAARDERVGVFEKLVATEREQNTQKEARIAQLEKWLRFERSQTQEKEAALQQAQQHAANLTSIIASKDQETATLHRLLEDERTDKSQQAASLGALLDEERRKLADIDHERARGLGRLAALNRHMDMRNLVYAQLTAELTRLRRKLRQATPPRRLKKQRAQSRTLMAEIKQSALFDADWYRENYPDVAAGTIDPLRHFVDWGLIELLQPHALFDPLWYLLTHKDIRETNTNPFLHFLRWGAIEDRDPHPLFDCSWYLTEYPDVAAAKLNPLSHYIGTGAQEGRNPHPLFDVIWYRTQYPDMADTGMDPLSHYLRRGAAEGKNPHPLFDGAWYLQSYPDVAASGQNPLIHYVSSGGIEGRAPHPLFDGAWYLQHYPDVAQAQVNPLIHYVTVGEAEGRDPHPLFSTRHFQEQLRTAHRQDPVS